MTGTEALEREIFAPAAGEAPQEPRFTEKEVTDIVHVSFLRGIGAHRHFIQNREVFDTFEKWEDYRGHQLEVLVADLLKKQLL